MHTAAKPQGAKKTVEKRRYRKVSTRMYADEKFLALSAQKPSGQSLWLYLITGPHTNAVPGLFVAGEGQFTDRLGWPVAAFRKCWKEIADLGMVVTDKRTHLVWLPNAIRHNVPESANVVTSWKDHLDELPACDLRDRALWDIYSFLQTVGEKGAFAKAFREVLPHGAMKRVEDFGEVLPPAFVEGGRRKTDPPSPNQEQEQEGSPQPPMGAVGERKPQAPDWMLTDPDLTERAGRFIERYQAVYEKAKHGAFYRVIDRRDWPRAVELVHAWPDLERLVLMAEVFLKRTDIGQKNVPGTIGQFAHMAPDCDAKLREHGR